MRSSTSSRHRLAAITVLVGLTATAAAGLGALPSSAADQPSAASPSRAASGTEPTRTVTLITGDVVEVLGDDAAPQLLVRPPADAPGRTYSRFSDPSGDLHVVPADVEALVGDQLDEDLFNVSLLLRDGYDDASAPRLPLIVQYAAGPVPLPATDVVRALPSIGGAAVAVDRAAARTLGTALAVAADDRAVAGVTKIWLDERVHAALDESVPQVGAPEVWADGITGSGVRIGVVDTGVDADHPDLAGRVVAEAAFTGDGGDADDVTGHGTHVASIAVGDGSASEGRFRGVAYDAEIVSARVLNEFGEGASSWVIAGLEWAAGEQDADVVNVSINSGPSDGSDPVSQAIDALTDQTGALFVVSAGNDGYGTPGTVYAPATADDALAVGAVTKRDRLADFTGIGPRLGVFGVKPEIVAPGVDITAARAAGAQIGEPVGEDYLVLSGTSMAAPHVTGAAALLLQAEPDLTWDQLKARLVSSALDLGYQTFEQGGGRLDVPAAVDQVVQPDLATINLGTLEFPHDDGETAAREITFTNTGPTAISADLEVSATSWDGADAPAQMITVEPAALVVPGGGSATATVTFDAAHGEIGAYGGALVATADDAPLLRVPLGFEKEEEKYDLSIEAVGPDGTGDFDGNLTLLSLETDVLYERIQVGGDFPTRVDLRLPRGAYSAVLQLYQDGPYGPAVYDVSEPELVLDRDTALVLDAADTLEVTAEITDAVTPVDVGVAFQRSSATGTGIFSLHDATGIPGVRLFVRPTEPVTIGEYFFTSYQNYSGDGVSYHLVHPEPGGIPTDLSYPAGPGDLARVDHSLHADVPGRPYQLALYGGTDEFVNEASGIAVAAGTVHTTWVTGDGVLWREVVAAGADVSQAELTALDQGYETGSTSEKSWFAAPVRPGGREGIPVASRFGGSMSFEFYPFVDPEQHFGFADPGLEVPSVDEIDFSLALDGEVIKAGTDLGELFVEGLPAREAEYEVTVDVARTAEWWRHALRTSTRWSFRSDGAEESYPTMLQVDTHVDVDLLNQVVAGPIPVTFDVYVPGFEVPAPPADVAELAAWVSPDDGTTWTEIAVDADGPGSFSGSIDAPCAGTCDLSLRVTAEDADGATIDQTVQRAFTVVAATAPPTTSAPPTSGTPTPTVTTTLPGTGGGSTPSVAVLGLVALIIGGALVALSARRLRPH